MRKAHYPQMCDVDKVLHGLEVEEERQREALRRFYARNSSGHYSGPLRRRWNRLPVWKRVIWIGCTVMVLGSAVAIGLIQWTMQ